MVICGSLDCERTIRWGRLRQMAYNVKKCNNFNMLWEFANFLFERVSFLATSYKHYTNNYQPR